MNSTPVLISDLTHPAVIITLAIASLSLLVLLIFSFPLYHGHSWRIVKMRGLIHLQFVTWALFFISVYNIILVLTGLFNWNFYAAWTVINLRRWAFLFAIFSLLTFQVVLSSIRNLTGQAQCPSCLKWAPLLLHRCGFDRDVSNLTDQAEELQFLLRRCVLISTLGYLPLFIISMTVPVFPGQHQGYLAVYIVSFLIFTSVIITTHIYMIFTQHIPRYYSHNRSHIVMLGLTDLLIIGWILYWSIIGDGPDLGSSRGQASDYNGINLSGSFLLAEAAFDCTVILIWVLIYCTPAVAAIILAWCGYPNWRDEYESQVSQVDLTKVIKKVPQLDRSLRDSPGLANSTSFAFSDSFEEIKQDKLLDVIMSTLSGAKLLALT